MDGLTDLAWVLGGLAVAIGAVFVILGCDLGRDDEPAEGQ